MQFPIGRIGLAGLMACLLCGCGPEPPEFAKNLVPVSGAVTMQGEPLADAVIYFTPTDMTGRAAEGVTDESGQYTLTTHNAGPGAVPGKYQVSVSKFVMPDGSPVPEGTPPADVEAVESIPPVYSMRRQSRLNATVPEGGGDDIDFNLK